MYVRVCRTVREHGQLVRPEEVESIVGDDREVDWYRSAFTYGEDVKEYFEANKNSIKGYTGDSFTTVPYFDLDCEKDFEKARKAALDVIQLLIELGFEKATEVYFSGNKGFHILVHTTTKFNREETQQICHNMSREAGVPNDVFDTSVYNVTRIFRITNTKHQKSGLYKIPLSFEELEHYTEDEIRGLAEKPRFEELDTQPEAGDALKKFIKKIVETKDNVYKMNPNANPNGEPDYGSHNDAYEELERKHVTESGLDLDNCPPGHRRCVWCLEQGHFGPGERHNAVIRLAAYYRAQGFNRKYADVLIKEALQKRAIAFPQSNTPSEAENQRDIDQIYSKDWKGGAFTCKTDAYLQSKCDLGQGPCFEESKSKARNVMNITQLFNSYVEYSQEALEEYPKFGIDWLDERMRIRPKNITVINGANGSGKTSLVIQAIENFNKQGIHNIFFSLDMANSSIFEKIASRYTDYSPKEIEDAFNVNTADEKIILEVKAVLEEKLPYTFFDFTSSAKMRYMEETTLALKKMDFNIQVVIVDYAGRIPGEHDNAYANSTANALSSNDFAKRTNTHIIFLSQVSRENGDHTDPLRTSRVSKDSGAWEENATNIINCWRPFGSGLDGDDKYIHLYIAKNRSGALGEQVFGWEGRKGDISTLSRRDLKDYVQQCEVVGLDVPKFIMLQSQNREDSYEEDDDRISKDRRFIKKNRDDNDRDEEELSDYRPGKFRRSKPNS